MRLEANAQQAFTINAHLVRRLSELAADKHARFFPVSTDWRFRRSAASLAVVGRCAKGSGQHLRGLALAMGEDLALLNGGDTVVVRVASLFGVAGASGKGGNFVETMLRLAKEKGELRVVADQTMSPTSTADVADAMIDLVLAKATPGIWHIVNSGAATWFEFAERIVSDANIKARMIPIKTEQFPTPAARPRYSALDNAKFSKAIHALRPWQDALKDYLVAKGHR